MTNSKKMKILVELMHGMGDTVCALPMLYSLRAHYPDADITVLTKNACGKEIIERSCISVNRILTFNIYGNVFIAFKFIRKLRSNHFTIAISSSITPVKKAKIFIRLISPKKWIGLQKRGYFLDNLKGKYHLVEAELATISELYPVKNDDIKFALYPELFAVNRLKEKIQSFFAKKNKIIGICIGDADYSLKNKVFRYGKVYPKAWGKEKMADLILELQKFDYNMVLIGGKQEIPTETYIKEKLKTHDRVMSFVGKTSVSESIALASLVDCMVGIDTGMQQLLQLLELLQCLFLALQVLRYKELFQKKLFLWKAREIVKIAMGRPNIFIVKIENA